MPWITKDGRRIFVGEPNQVPNRPSVLHPDHFSQSGSPHQIQGNTDRVLNHIHNQAKGLLENKGVDTIPDFSTKGFLQLGLKDTLTGDRQSFTFQAKPNNSGKVDLQLSDMYLPKRLQGQGILTNLLSKIKDHPDLSGNLAVSVGKNVEGWRKIISRSGFNQIAPF